MKKMGYLLIKMKKRIGFLLFFLFILTFSREGIGFELVDEVVAAVNEDIITREELEEEVRIFKLEMGIEVGVARLKKDILQRMIEEYLLQQEAEREGFTVSKMEVQRALENLRGDIPQEKFIRELKKRGVTLEELEKRLERQILREKLIKWKAKLLGEEVRIGKSEVENFLFSLKHYLGGEKSPGEVVVQFYRIYSQELEEEEKVYLAQIIVESEEKAREVLERLSRGEEFSTLAERFSLSSEAEKGGELGWFRLTELHPSLRSIIGKLGEGEVSQPIKINQNLYQLLQVKERREISFQKWEKRIRDFLVKKEVIEGLEKWLSELKEKSFIQIMDESLKDG